MIDKKIEEFSDAMRNIEDIKANYPDEWILLGNPEMNERGDGDSFGCCFVSQP